MVGLSGNYSSTARPQASPTNSQIDKQSIPEAADGSTERLIDAVVVPVHIAIVVVHVAVPGVVIVVLGSTPEESVVSNIVETTIVIAITTWENQR